MFKIALFAVNDCCEIRERSLKAYITKEMASYLGFEVMDFTGLSHDEMVDLAKEEADRTIIVFDAVRGMNLGFSHAASKLHGAGIHPILLISNSDHQNADISQADTSLAEIWSLEDPTLESWDLNFHKLYFSYDKMGIDTTAKVETNNIEALMKFIA